MSAEHRTGAPAIQRNEVASEFQSPARMETSGKSLSVTCLNDAIDASGIDRKVLALECEMSDSYFSKSVWGQRGGHFTAVVDVIRSEIRADYAERLALTATPEGLIEIAAQRLAKAAVDFLAISHRIGTRARMAKAGL